MNDNDFCKNCHHWRVHFFTSVCSITHSLTLMVALTHSPFTHPHGCPHTLTLYPCSASIAIEKLIDVSNGRVKNFGGSVEDILDHAPTVNPIDGPHKNLVPDHCPLLNLLQ